ncbi:MAG: hypothetical protein ABH858_05650 [Candidatus Omnitrophota bacterium]
MVVVIVIIAVIIASFITAFATVNSTKLEAQARKIVSDLYLARELALANNIDYCINFDFNANTNRYYYETYQGACLAGTLIGWDNLPPYVSFSVPAVPFTLTFYTFDDFQMGGQASSPASINSQLAITLNQDSAYKTVRVFEDTGYVKIE